ncbi:vigilin [Condylostylus longicornis]|uniref:vigilin n=1 Tax=Condylostylus longicornis TaxID=2530218 RepID=UPI00244E0291|nr:vigilin [Condylostylus longicornis]XP_055371641.1 vigilin [Condylostylus longicornis]
MEESNVNDSVQAQDDASAQSQQQQVSRTYDDLFPALSLPQNQGIVHAPPKNMRVASSVRQQIVHVPYEERKSSDSEKFGEGESLRTCQQIMKETGANIEISSGKDNSLTFLIKGQKREILEARRRILIQFQTQASKQILIPKEHRPVILGKRGERLRELEQKTATKISIPSMTDDSDSITISGTKEGIEKAEHDIRAMVEEQSKKAFERFSIPKIYHPFIAGPLNSTLNNLMKDTGAKIIMPSQTATKDEISITGEKDGVLAAKAKIEEIYKEMEKKCSTVSVEVAKTQHRHIIGKGGQTLQEIFLETGVWVEMPPHDSSTDTITLRGPQTALGNALTIVYEKANSVKTVKIDAPTWIFKYIIGRKGSKIEKFEQEFPHVSIFCLEDAVKLEGPPETVERAQAHLEKFIQDFLAENTFVIMDINPNCVKHIIGKGGVNIKRLKEEYQVYIYIDEQSGDKIRIEGKKEDVAKAQQELKEKIVKLENEIVKDVKIDQHLHRYVIGAKGEKIRELKDRYKNVQIMFPLSTDNSDIVRLRGPKEEVHKLDKDLNKLVKEIQEHSFVVQVPIFKQFHKYIIGKGGVNIKKIRDETQTKIELPAEGDTNDVIIITGKKENVLEAKELIQKKQNELSEIVTEEVDIPRCYHNSIIGAGGKLVNAIMEECGGVSIKFPQNETKSDKVLIRGPKDDVEKAKTQLLEIANEKQLHSFTAEVRTKQQHLKFIIGKNGASIRKIREATGARIIFPNNDGEDKELITIIGKEEDVKAAKEQLESIIKDIETEDEISVDPKYHRHFMAKRCEAIRQISDGKGVVISFPRPGQEPDCVKLKGAKEDIEFAKQRIREIVEELEAQITIEVIIPQKHHRNIMGPRGSKVQAITKEFDVQIKFPDRDAREIVEDIPNGDEENSTENNEQIRQCDIIRITGRKEKCEAAEKALRDSIPITEEVNVAFDLHRSIIGQKGKDVRELMQTYDVNIELSPQDLKQDVIKIIGTKVNVAKAKEALFKRVEELEADRKDRELRSYELRVEIDPFYHPKIIGKRGAVVTKLRSDHNVNISFPKKEDDNDSVIIITGYEEHAIACRDEILDMVKELYKETVEVNSTVHNRLIGQRGRNIRKIMEDYKVDIKFPKEGDPNPNAIVIIGKEDDVENAREHILCLEEEYLQDVNYTIQQVFDQPNTNSNGFVVQGAPWEQGKNEKPTNDVVAPNTQSQKDFPDFGGSGKNTNDSTPIASAWGPRR